MPWIIRKLYVIQAKLPDVSSEKNCLLRLTVIFVRACLTSKTGFTTTSRNQSIFGPEGNEEAKKSFKSFKKLKKLKKKLNKVEKVQKIRRIQKS